jgi:hypothetical protein
LLVHIGDPSSNQATTLESQVIHMIQVLSGQTLRGRGECRVPTAPAASCALCSGRTHTSNNEYTGTPDIPARNGFNGLCRALPGDRALLPPSSRGYVLSKPGWADATPQNLTPASGRQDHTILPSAATSLVSGLLTAHRPFDLPCDPIARKTLPRPPHPTPRP